MRRFLKTSLLRSLLVLLTLICFSAASYAQKTVSGTVVDEQGQTLPGVNVMEKGTTNGTITDIDGKYSLNVGNNSTLEFSYIGYENVEINASNGTTFNVTLTEDTKQIDEVVVVGYGTMKKSDVSGSSITVGASDIEGFVGSGIDQALQGKAAGVQITANSGQPGGGMQVQIRGAATLNAKDAQPLYVVDGVPLQNVVSGGLDYGLNIGNGAVGSFSGVSNLNPEDIESMEVLKDASATAIYGSRAANGVVLITTKQGKKGKVQFNYSGSTGWQTQVERLDVLDLGEYARYKSAMYSELDLANPDTHYLDYTLLGSGTNWQDAVFRTAFMHNHQLSASGGTDRVRYYLSAGYYDQDGTVIGTNFNRFTTRVNLDADVTDWLKVGTNTSYATSNDKLVMNNSTDGIISLASWSAPDIPVYDANGNYATSVRDGYSFENPVAKALDVENKLARKNIDATFYAEMRFMKELSLRSEYSTSNLFTNSYAFTPTYDYGNVKNTVNTCTQGKYENRYWQVKNYLTYTNTFAELHSLTAMFGQETSEWSYENVQASNSGLSSNYLHQADLGTGTPTISTGKGSGARVSMFGRFFYGFNSRYNMTYTYRRDGSSNFGPDKRWGNFHSVSASWKFSDEPFMKFAENVMNNGRLRIGWGQVGNDNLPGYAWGSYGESQDVGQNGKGYLVRRIPNTEVSWETQESWNLGIDLNFLHDRFQFVFELYKKTSKNMLMTMQLPSYMGTEGNDSYIIHAPSGNFGEMSNKGFEITFNSTNINKKGFQWTTNFQFSKNVNELVSLEGSGSTAFYGRPQWDGVGDYIAITEAGRSLYQFYGYVTDGLYQNYEDLVNSPRPENTEISRNGVWIGDVKYKDLDGDGVITAADQTIIGDPNPDFTFGLTNTFTYKGFELSIFVNGSYGNDVFNYNKLTLTGMSSQWMNQLTDVLDHAVLVQKDASVTYPRTITIPNAAGTATITKEVYNWKDDPTNVVIQNSGTDVPRMVLGDPANNDRHSDRYIEDGSFIKIKSISLGYNIPKKYTKMIKVNSAKVYCSVSNLHTFTKYTGMDPEIGVSQTTAYVSGVDIGRYPSPRIFTIGLNLQF